MWNFIENACPQCPSEMQVEFGLAVGFGTGRSSHGALFTTEVFLVASKADEALISLAGVHLDSLALWWVEDEAGASSPWASARASSCLHLGYMEFVQSLPGQGVQYSHCAHLLKPFRLLSFHSTRTIVTTCVFTFALASFAWVETNFWLYSIV